MAYLVPDLSGNDPFLGITVGDPKTNNNRARQQYVLATNATLAAGAATTPITNVESRTYIWDTSFGGTTPNLNLQTLDSAGNWRNVGSAISANGSVSVTLGQFSSVRMFNAGANPITALYGTLS